VGVDEGWNCVLGQNPMKDSAVVEKKGEMQVLVKGSFGLLVKKERVALL